MSLPPSARWENMLAHFQDLYPLHTEEAREGHLSALRAHLFLSAEVAEVEVACLCYQAQHCYKTTRRMAAEFRFYEFPRQYNSSLPVRGHNSHRNARSAGVHFHKLYNSTSSVFLCLPECAMTIDSIIIGSSITSLKNTKKDDRLLLEYTIALLSISYPGKSFLSD